MAFKPGQSGNPNGRPRRAYTLTRMVETELSKTMLVEDKKVAKRRIIARQLVQAVTERKVVFPDGSTIVIADSAWFDDVMKLLTHLDGKTNLNIEGTLTVLWDAPRPNSQT